MSLTEEPVAEDGSAALQRRADIACVAATTRAALAFLGIVITDGDT